MVKDISGQRFHSLKVLEYCGNNKHKRAMWLCRCDCGINKVIPAANLMSNRTRSCGCIKRKNIAGHKFGRLLVIEHVGQDTQQMTLWKCQCDCGKIIITRGTSLRYGSTMSCGCYTRDRASESSWKGFEEISGWFLCSIKRHAKNRGIDFNISNEQLWDQYISQNKKCNLSGLEIGFTRSCKDMKKAQTASLDRIDSNKHYTIDNIQWVHKHINNMKWGFDQNEFLSFVYLVCNPIPDDEIYNSYSLDVKDRSKVQGWLGCGNMSMKQYSNIKNEAIRRNILLNISIKDCWDLFVKQNGKCAMTGLRLITMKNGLDNNIASLDRIDNTKGYLYNNVQWVHKNINFMKYNFEYKVFVEYCRLINRHNKKTINN